MKIIANHASGKVLKRDALQIGAEAKLAKISEPTTIDATIGTFYPDDKKFRAFKTVLKIMNNLPDDKVFTYSPSDGGKEFGDALINWVFEKQRAEIENKMHLKAIPTPGGTGALSISIFNSLDYNQTLLIPNLYWGPYVGMANNNGFVVEKFEFFENNQFNLRSFIEKSNQIIEKQGKLVVILNDPCNNPSGYSMSNNELSDVIEYMNSKQNIPCVLIYDIAYIDYAYEGREKTREKLLIFTKANPNVLIAIAFSGSKTFAVYGQRLGGVIYIGKDKENVIEFFNAGNFAARNTWSNCNKTMLSLLTTFNLDPHLKQEVLSELNEVVLTLKERSEIFIEEANQIGLKIHPYHSGFFITIPVVDNELVLQALINDEKLYLLPFEKSVRIALCALSVNELKGLAQKIKNVIDSIEGKIKEKLL